MIITHKTIVKEAIESSDQAIIIFMQHGIEPIDSLAEIYDHITLEEAQSHCQIADLDRLIADLNDALDPA